MSRPRAVVVGGGIAGLATGALLARGGAQVTVLERHHQAGGRAGRLEADGFTFDTGPTWYFMPEVFEHFFALLGRDIAEHVRLRRLDPAYRVFTEPDAGAYIGPDTGPTGTPAEPLEVVADAEANWRTFEAIEPGAGRAFREYAAASSHAYRMALDHFLYTTYARPDRVLAGPVLRELPELARLLTTSLADHIEATVTTPRLRQILGYHAVFLGSSPYRAPAFYSLMSHLDLVDGVHYPDGGIYMVIDAIARAAQEEGATLRFGEEVLGIDVVASGRSQGRRTGRVRSVRLAGGETIEADVVVVTGDLRHAETALLDEAWQSYPESYWERRDPGISSLLVYAGVRGELPELAHHSLFFTRDWPANFEAILGPADGHAVPAERLRVPFPASLYVSRSSATDPSAAPAGHEALMLLVPFPADPAIGSGPDGAAELDRLADRYLGQVADWAGIPDLLERVVVRRVVGPADFARRFSAWRGSSLGMEHTLLQSALFRPADVSRRVPNLLYAGGGTVPGVGLPMCLISAELIAKRLLGETSTAPLPAPLRRGFLNAALPRGRRHVAVGDRGAEAGAGVGARVSANRAARVSAGGARLSTGEA